MGAAPAPIRQPTSPTPTGQVSSAQWAANLIDAINLKLPAGSKKILVTNTNIANIQRMIGAESGGNTAGFLRDNNPLNLNTYASPHSSLWSTGSVVPEFGIYVQKFNSVTDGITATADQFLQPSSAGTIAALQNNAPAPVFGGSLSSGAWSGQSYANASAFSKLTPANITGTGQPLTVNPTGTVGQVLQWSNRNLPGASAVNSAASAVGSSVTSVGGFISKVTNPTNLKNVGIFMAGVSLTIVGLVILMQQSKSVRMVEGTATKAAMA